MNPVSAPRVGVLGPVTLAGGEAGGALARALVAALARGGSRAGEVRPVAVLADEVWGDEPPQNPRAALQTLVSRVRASAGSDLVASAPSGYALGVPADEIDLWRARALADRSDELPAHAAERLDLIDSALALWRGEPGADLGDAPIAALLAEESAQLHRRLIDLRARSLVALERPGEAVDLLRAQAVARPFDEDVHRDLMVALAANGAMQEALAVFARLRERLRDELGASPSPETVDLHAGLLRSAPDASAPRVRIGLRAAPNQLIGRDDALAQVATLLGRSRLVTVLGPGGLGKTRLAQATAAASTVPAVVVVELASVRADADVEPAIASALGITEAGASGRLADVRARADLRGRILGQLAERATLLVLDNCEQVIDGVARFAAEALEAIPSLRLLATSRTPLAIGAESVYPLDPLADLDEGEAGPAVQLFLERARAVRPGALLPLDVVARLCARLDGLPLAIELAAARVRTMTPEQIEARLRDRFALLTTGDRAAPERHRTLEAVIAWSWDLLDADAQHALAVLSVLPAGFSLATAADVLLEQDADDLLDRLVSQSLLIVTDDPVNGGVRFRMLETVREFGLSRLAATRAEADAWDAVNAWADAFCRSRVTRIFEVEAFREVRAEHDNLLAVLRRAIANDDPATTVVVFAVLAQTWIVRGAFSEVGVFASDALAASAHVGADEVGVDALAAVLALGAFGGSFAGWQGAVRSTARLRILHRRHPEMDAVGTAVAEIIGAGADPARIAAALARVRSSPDPRTALIGELATAQFAENTGDPLAADAAAHRSWALAEELGEVWVSSMSASALAQLASQSGRPAESMEWLDRASAGFAAFGADDELRQEVWVRGVNYVALGDLDAARVLFRDLSEMRSVSPDGQELAAVGWFGLAEVDRAEGRGDAAAEHYRRAVAAFRSTGQQDSPWFLLTLAGLVSAAAFDGSMPADELALWARRLRTRTIALRRAHPEFLDRPIFASVLLAWAAWAITVPDLRPRALDAYGLADLLGARRDLPSLSAGAHRAHAIAYAGGEAVDAAVAAAASIPADERVERAFVLLGHRA